MRALGVWGRIRQRKPAAPAALRGRKGRLKSLGGMKRERGIPSFPDVLTRAGRGRALTICSQQAQRTLLRPAEMHAHVLC
jgi:hypothetical protein